MPNGVMVRLHKGALPPRLWTGIPVPAHCGAEVLFAGVVRNEHDGLAVTGMRYHAHAALAEKRLAEIEQEAARRFNVEVRLAHAVGELVVGDVSVVIAVHAPHRVAAFDACRWVIDTIKHAVPIWKEERYAEGESRFLEGQPIKSVIDL